MRWAYGLPRRNYLWARTRALVGSLTIILALAVVTVTISAASAAASSQTGWRAWVSYTVLVIGAVALLFGIMSALYAFAIGRTTPRPRILPGALISAIGVMGVYIGLGVALRFTAGYQAVYGALAGTIIVMMVLYISSYIMLIGALVNGRWDIAASQGQPSSVSARAAPAKSGT
jgi:membrane protein